MNVREAIIKIIEDGQNFEVYSKICIVDSVDKALNTIDVSPIDGDAELVDVNLIADNSATTGLIIYPVVGSNVIITFIDKDSAFMSMATDIEEVIYKDGTNGGLINIQTLISNLNKNNQILNALLNGFSTFTPVAQDGGAALKVVMSSLLAGLQTGDFSSMEDETFKH